MIIHQTDCPLQPWRNGLGRTREIAVQTSSTGEGFLWRISVAEVDSAAPFSPFPGIDRSIVLLDGAGFVMTLDGVRKHRLTTAFAPFAFPGEAQVAVALAAGPTRDFNLMVKRAEARGQVQVWRGSGTRLAPAGAVLVYCAGGSVDTPDGRLQIGDAWRPEAIASRLALSDDAVALVALVTPRVA
jgi:environmental stress-induced protein Ves